MLLIFKSFGKIVVLSQTKGRLKFWFRTRHQCHSQFHTSMHISKPKEGNFLTFLLKFHERKFSKPITLLKFMWTLIFIWDDHATDGGSGQFVLDLEWYKLIWFGTLNVLCSSKQSYRFVLDQRTSYKSIGHGTENVQKMQRYLQYFQLN